MNIGEIYEHRHKLIGTIVVVTHIDDASVYYRYTECTWTVGTEEFFHNKRSHAEFEKFYILSKKRNTPLYQVLNPIDINI